MSRSENNSTQQSILYRIFLLRYLVLAGAVSIAMRFIPFLGTFPYRRDLLMKSGLPSGIFSWANFDGVHYIHIARDGYHQFDQAFFPLYPLLVRMLSWILPYGEKGILMAGLILSNVFFIVGVYALYAYLKKLLTDTEALWAIVFLIAYPTAFYFSAMYTESLFLVLTAGSLYFAYKKRFLLSALLAGLSSFTRIQGVLLLIPFIFMLYNHRKTISENAKHIFRSHALFLLSPFIGCAAYMVYLYYSTGDPIYFLTSQPAFSANRSTSIVLLPQVYFRYLKIFLTADRNFQYWVSVIEFISATATLSFALWHAWISWMHKKMHDLGIALFSMGHVIMPTLTGTFSSVPRYSLFAFSTFIVLSGARSTKMKIVILIISALLQCVFAMYFIQGYFIS